MGATAAIVSLFAAGASLAPALGGLFGGKKDATAGAPALPTSTAATAATDQTAALKAAQDQRRLAAASAGRSDTILTGGLGALGATPGMPKTLLGE